MIITFLLLLLAAFFNGCMDLMQFHYHTSIFRHLPESFWDPRVSWLRKWKKDSEGWLTEKPAFPGSTTFLVWLTDGWHLFQMLMWTSMQAAIALHFSPSSLYINHPITALLCDVFLFKIIMGTFEEIILRTLKKKS